MVWGAILTVAALVRHRAGVLVKLWPVVLGGVPFVVATLAYNQRITGELLTFPIVGTDPLDTFGFGDRRLMPGFEIVDYGPGLAAIGTVKNSAFFLLFLAGNVVAGGLAVFATWVGRRRSETWILLTIAGAFPVGYFFFWGTNVSSLTARLVGSIYYIPSVVPVLALALVGATELRRRSRPGFHAVAVAAVLVTIPVLVTRIDVNHRISIAQEPWAASVRGIDADALVIVASSGPYLLFANPLSSNQPTYDDRILYALDRGAANLDTIRRHPDRIPYLQVASAASRRARPTRDSDHTGRRRGADRGRGRVDPDDRGRHRRRRVRRRDRGPVRGDRWRGDLGAAGRSRRRRRDRDPSLRR